VFGKDGQGEPSRPGVDAMGYTLAVVKESLRKYSVVPVVTRKLAADDELLGHKMPAGIMVACHLQVGVARRP
jgi:cytochrome P450